MFFFYMGCVCEWEGTFPPFWSFAAKIMQTHRICRCSDKHKRGTKLCFVNVATNLRWRWAAHIVTWDVCRSPVFPIVNQIYCVWKDGEVCNILPFMSFIILVLFCSARLDCFFSSLQKQKFQICLLLEAEQLEKECQHSCQLQTLLARIKCIDFYLNLNEITSDWMFAFAHLTLEYGSQQGPQKYVRPSVWKTS